MNKKILEIKNLTKYYGKVLGVKDLSLTLYEGEVFGFIGPNGAGKSTTIRSIMNLINKTEGCVLLNGKELNKDNIALKELIGYLPSEIHLYEDLSVKEMLDYHESFYKKNCHKRRKELVKKLKLDESKKIEELLKEIPKENLIEPGTRKVYKLEEDKNEFQIVKEEDMYVVIGPAVEKLMSRVNLEDTESMYYFQRKLDELGVNEALKKAGVKDGDTVKVVDWELEWYD